MIETYFFRAWVNKYMNIKNNRNKQIIYIFASILTTIGLYKYLPRAYENMIELNEVARQHK